MNDIEKVLLQYRAVRNALGYLTEKEFVFLMMSLERKISIKTLAVANGYTQERVRQTISNAKRKLKAMLFQK
jgi:DNA-binding CsgD family transcriptional regulator